MSTCGCWGATRCRCEPAPVHGHLYVSRRDAKTSVRIVAVGQGEVCFCLQLSQAQMEKGSWISLASDLFLVLAQGVAWSSNPLSISRVEVWWNLCFSWRVCFPFVESSWFSMRTMRLPRDGVRERCRRHEASLRRTWPSPGLGPLGGAPSAVVHHAQDRTVRAAAQSGQPLLRPGLHATACLWPSEKDASRSVCLTSSGEPSRLHPNGWRTLLQVWEEKAFGGRTFFSFFSSHNYIFFLYNRLLPT